MKVLIADDHAEWRYILARILSADYTVVAYDADFGDQLLEFAIRVHPDVITLDISMPGQNGLAILPSLRAALPWAIIVIVSTNTSAIYQQESLARGADDYVPKHRVLSDLIPAIAAVRGRARFGQRNRA